MILRKFFYLFFLILTPVFCFPFEIGPKIGFGFESWERSSVPYDEQSFLITETGAIAHFSMTRRLHLFVHGGATFATDTSENKTKFYNFYTGSTIGWIIHPDYSPYIGGGIFYKYYPDVADFKNKGIVTLIFSGGAKVMKFSSSAVWIILDYGIFNSEYKSFYNSYFSLSLSYLFNFF